GGRLSAGVAVPRVPAPLTVWRKRPRRTRASRAWSTARRARSPARRFPTGILLFPVDGLTGFLGAAAMTMLHRRAAYHAAAPAGRPPRPATLTRQQGAIILVSVFSQFTVRFRGRQ